MGDSSDIDALIKDMNSSNLSQEENSMVNSILNELNGPSEGSGPQVTSQQQKPQITDEEKEMLMKQQMQEQQIAQQRMQQQQMMQQQQEQIQQQAQIQEQILQAQQAQNESTLDKIKNTFFEYKDVFIVLLISILFNLEIVSSNLTLKNVSFMYDMETGKEKILSSVFKGVIIAVLFFVLKILIK